MRTLCIFYLVLLLSCKSRINENFFYDARVDIRLNARFYSMYFKKNGEAFVVKGLGSNYTDSLIVKSSDTSNKFRVDSVFSFFSKLDKLDSLDVKGPYRVDAPRVEIYYHKRKIYDVYNWDETFWDLFRPIMEQLPSGFNPLLANERPFG